MGGSVSRAGRSLFTGGSEPSEPPQSPDIGGGGDGSSSPTSAFSRLPHTATALVLTRRGSMYFDDDDDLAHEFFEQVPARQSGRTRMRRVNVRKLRPQGRVKYRFPRLNVDFPIVLFRD